MENNAPKPMTAEEIAEATKKVPGLVEDLVAGDLQAMKTFMELSGQKIASITVTPVKN